jgi:hypothetical protein
MRKESFMKSATAIAIVTVLLAGVFVQGCKKEEAKSPPAKSTPGGVETPPPRPVMPTPVPVATAPAMVPTPAPVVPDTAAKEAQASLDKVAGLIKDGKLAEADQELKALEAKAGSLSPEMQAKIKTSRTSLDAAKTAESQTLLEKAIGLINSGKLDDADKVLKELEGKMSMLPQPMQEKIKAARTAFDAKKAAGGLGIPSVGG